MSTTLSTPMMQHIPSIVVTPALPSRNSLSPDMRTTLDSIIGGYESREEPYARLHNSPADAENTFRLELDLENARFSVGRVVSALEAACRTVPGRDAASRRSTVTDDMGDTPTRISHRQRPKRVALPADYISTTDRYAAALEYPSHAGDIGLEEPEDASDEEGLFDARVVRRTPRHVGMGHPTWRHAMYISTLVWPAEETGANTSRRKAEPSGRVEAVKHRLRWSPFWSLSRALAPIRMQVRKERGGGRK